jgi:hypothetical protein
MERNVQRINGEVEQLHRLSNEELDQHLTHAFLRLDAAQSDVDRLLHERHIRILGSGVIQQELDFSTFDDGFSTDGMGRE